MSGTLYHYLHCPFCVRVRLALGYLGVNYRSVVVPYDDEKTPIDLCGKKMLPIWQQEDGAAINESLDIIVLLDKDNRLKTKDFGGNDKTDLEALLSAYSGPAFNLIMPYWVQTKEFSESARHYFQKKKEEKRGPFKDLIKNKKDHIAAIEPVLKKIEGSLQPFYQSSEFSIKDILIASHLWGLYLVPEFRMSEKLHHYLQNIKQITNFNYLDEAWN